MSTASLVVKLAVDINDFSSKLDKATKDVDKAGKKVESVGRSLTLGITAPAALAAVALGKMAAENEDAAGRVSRVFGGMATSVEGSIKRMMKSIPETQTDMEQMAVSVDNVIQGFDVAPQKAAVMSESLMKLAGDASAFAHIPMREALEDLEKGLTGSAKGLKTLGLGFTEADLKQRAIKMGLLSYGNELTETGTALAAYSLIMEKSSRIQGEAARTSDQQGKSFAFLKRDLSELADGVSHIVLPSLSSLASGVRGIVDDLQLVPEPVTKVTFALIGAAAVIGPTIILVSKLAKAYVALKEATALLSAGKAASGIAAMAGPIGWVTAGVIALTGALVTLYAVVDARRNKAATQQATSADLLANDPALDAALAQQSAGKSGNTQRNPKSPIDQLKEGAGFVSSAFKDAVEHGTDLNAILERANKLHREAASMVASNSVFSKEAEGARSVADEMQRIVDIGKLAGAAPGADRQMLQAIANRPFNAGIAGAQNAVDAANAYRQDLATRSAASQYGVPFNATAEAVVKSRNLVGSTDNDLALREALLKLPDGFDAARQASVEFAESQRQSQEELELTYEKTKLSFTTVAGAAMTAGSFLTNLAARVGGGGLFGGIGSSLGGSFFSSLLSKGSSLIPFVGGLGSVAGAFIGKGLDSLFGHHKKASDDAASSLDTLAATAQKVNEALTNMPQGFKIFYDRFMAAAPVTDSPGGDPSTPSTPRGPGSGSGAAKSITIAGDAHFYGVSDIKELFDKLGAYAESNGGRGGTSGLHLAFGGT